MKIVLYEDKYKEQLHSLLVKFSKEVWDKGSSDTELFIDCHWAIYLCVVDDVVVGFSSYIYNHYFDLREPTVANTYLYVLPEYRKTKASYLLIMQTGKVVEDLNIPLEHYYASKSSSMLSRKIEGKKLNETYIYEVDDAMKVFNKMRKKVRIK